MNVLFTFINPDIITRAEDDAARGGGGFEPKRV